MSLPAASSHQAAQGARAAAHATAVRAGLQRSALLHQLARATAEYGKRDGPLPLHIEACAALLLVLGGVLAAHPTLPTHPHPSLALTLALPQPQPLPLARIALPAPRP